MELQSIGMFRKKSHTATVNEILSFLNEHFKGAHRSNLYYDLTDIRQSTNKIVAQLTRFGINVRVNYEDYDNVELNAFTNILAIELRELVGKNVFFDISDGKLFIWT